MNPDFRIDRRGFVRLSSLSWLGALAGRALASEGASSGIVKRPARSLIILYLNGGPSQLETFDPHPGSSTGGPTRAIATRADGVQFAESLPQSAEIADSLAIIRSLTSKEGDHERGQYMMKTGFRPNPAVTHPSIGAICAHNLPSEQTEIPLYFSILGHDHRARGGYLGDSFDPVAVGDPQYPPSNIRSRVKDERTARRRESLAVVESARGRRIAHRTGHEEQLQKAFAVMDSTQIDALSIEKESASVRALYGDTPFGRGCLAARRLVEVGVRCIEVELSGWDYHANNFEGHALRNAELDPALSGLIRDLKDHELFDETLIACFGEFGRTPKINALDGRDHWPKGFSAVLAGGPIRGGAIVGATDPEGNKPPTDPATAEDFTATLLAALGIDPTEEKMTRSGRPIKFSDGKVIENVLKLG